MNQITLLSQDTIDKIAAGEVIERPSSIVKELVENAIDAGANAITVEIRDGGISLIRITDNGSGIPQDQVRVAFLRHATSKIRTVDDLLTAGTLGFRGEALSSIAAVCQVELITKTSGSITGTRYVIEGGVEKSLEEIGAPEGTTFLVRNLFYHTPARRKFLKTAATEAGYVSDLMERMAISHPGISFKFINNNDAKLHTSGNCNLKDIIYGIYGREIAANVVKIDTGEAGIKIGGFIGKPVISRGNRNYENYFVNGRYVKSAIIARAIEDAYKPFMMHHRYPFTALMIEVDPEQVDVNVHPTKMEVRFADQAGVYEQVLHAVKDGLAGRELIPEFTVDLPKQGSRQSADAGIGVRSGAGSDTGTGTGVRSGVGGARPTGALSAGKMGMADAGASVGEAAGIDKTDRSALSESERAERKAESGSENGAVDTKKASRKFTYPEPFEKIRSQLIAEANSPYEAKYPRRESAFRMVTGNVRSGGSADTHTQATGAVNANDSARLQANDAVNVDNSVRPQATGAVRAIDSVEPQANDAERVDNSSQQNATGAVRANNSAQPQATGTVHADNSSQQNATGTVSEEVRQTLAAEIRETQKETSEVPVQMELFEDKLLDRKNRSRHKLIGQVFDTYWIVEFDEKMFIIDQHAAHEKVLYERLMEKLRTKEQTSQMITPPIIVTLNLQEETLLKQNMDQFTEVGFEISPFGGRDYAISAVPDNLYGIAGRTLFTEILDGLSDVTEKTPAQIVLEKIASMSCKAAVKGNSRLSTMEADALIEELLGLENPYNCPHGRPTIIEMTKYDLEKKFKRVL